MGKVQMQEANQVDQWIRNGAKFMFVPSNNLVEIVAKDEHPMVKAMPNPIKYVIMQNRPIRIEGSMALDYYLGTMDNKNCFVLDRGDIKIIPERFEVKKKEEND